MEFTHVTLFLEPLYHHQKTVEILTRKEMKRTITAKLVIRLIRPDDQHEQRDETPRSAV